MKKEIKLYKCELCGNFIYMIDDSGMVPVCCGQDMTPVIANTSDGAVEKHVPVIIQKGTDVHVDIGEAPHPMTEGHHIEWILLLTDKGLYVRALKTTDMPKADFKICLDEEVVSAYAFCNLHGLWVRKSEI